VGKRASGHVNGMESKTEDTEMVIRFPKSIAALAMPIAVAVAVFRQTPVKT